MSFFDLTFSVNDLILILGFVVSGCAQWFILKGRSQRNTEMIEEVQIKAVDAMESSVALHNRMSSLEVQMLKEFVSVARMQEIEVRLSGQISELRNDISNLTRFLMGNKHN